MPLFGWEHPDVLEFFQILLAILQKISKSTGHSVIYTVILYLFGGPSLKITSYGYWATVFLKL